MFSLVLWFNLGQQIWHLHCSYISSQQMIPVNVGPGVSASCPIWMGQCWPLRHYVRTISIGKHLMRGMACLLLAGPHACPPPVRCRNRLCRNHRPCRCCSSSRQLGHAPSSPRTAACGDVAHLSPINCRTGISYILSFKESSRAIFWILRLHAIIYRVKFPVSENFKQTETKWGAAN